MGKRCDFDSCLRYIPEKGHPDTKVSSYRCPCASREGEGNREQRGACTFRDGKLHRSGRREALWSGEERFFCVWPPCRRGEAAEKEKVAAPPCAGRPSCCGGGEPYRFFCRMEMFSMEREGRFMPPYLALFRSCLSFEKETAYGKHRVFF